MNLDIVRKLYNNSVDTCVDNGSNAAWTWELAFAEAIVRECIKIDQDAFYNDHSISHVFPAAKIKEHFGLSNEQSD